MKPHKILIKRKKSFDLNYQKNKFVLFVDENRTLDSGVPLHSEIKDVIKKLSIKRSLKIYLVINPFISTIRLH